ncbi:AraC family transcriptional regulator [Thalassotalea litorea]
MHLFGIDVSHYIHQCELPDRLLFKGDMKISTHLVYRFLDHVATSESCPDLGWQTGLKSGYTGLRGLASRALQEQTLKQCLKLIPRLTYTGASHADFFMLTRHDKVEFCHIGGVVRDYPGYYHVESYLVMVILDIIHQYVPASFTPSIIRLRSPEPKDWDRQLQSLMDNQDSVGQFHKFNLNKELISFGNPHTTIEFSNQYLNCQRRRKLVTISAIQDSASTDIRLPETSPSADASEPSNTRLSVSSTLDAPICRKSYPELANLIDILLPYFGQQMPSLNSVAIMGHISPRNLQRALKSQNLTLTLLIQQLRQELAVKLLMQGQSVQDIARRLGYQHSTHFIRTFKQLCGITPKQFQKNPQQQLPTITQVTQSIMSHNPL